MHHSCRVRPEPIVLRLHIGVQSRGDTKLATPLTTTQTVLPSPRHPGSEVVRKAMVQMGCRSEEMGFG